MEDLISYLYVIGCVLFVIIYFCFFIFGPKK